jgi:hypothetical protein
MKKHKEIDSIIDPSVWVDLEVMQEELSVHISSPECRPEYKCKYR